MYSCYLFLGSELIAEVKLKSITKVCKFVDTINFNLISCRIYSPNGNRIDAIKLKEIWNA